MATLVGVFTGNFTAASWLTADATALLDSEAGTIALTTSYQESSAFTPGAITVDGVAIKIASRAAGSPSNTITLRLATGGVLVTGTETTMNVSDIDACASTGFPASEGGWYYFRFNVAGTPTPVLLAAATAYTLSVKLSATTTAVSLFRSTASAANFSRLLATTTAAAPASGDALHIMGDRLAAGSSNSYTVTMDNTATTSWGPTVSGGPPQNISVSNGGTLDWGTTASTNYYFKFKGIFAIFSGGIVQVGTVGTPIPSTSTAVIEGDEASASDTRWRRFNGGVRRVYFASITNIRAMLAADAAAAATAITTDISTGWPDAAEIAIAPTSNTPTHGEKRTLNGAASGTTVNITSGLTNAHSGTAPIAAEVGLLTRGIKVRGVDSTHAIIVESATTGEDSWRYAEVYWFREALVARNTTGTHDVQYCSFHDPIGNPTLGGGTGSGHGAWTFSNNIAFAIGTSNNAIFVVAATTLTTWVVQSNLFISVGSGFGSEGVQLNDIGGTFTDHVHAGGISGSTWVGVAIQEAAAITGSIARITVHSMTCGVTIGRVQGGTIEDLTVWRCASQGIFLGRSSSGPNPQASTTSKVTIDGLTMFGNAQQIQTNAQGIGSLTIIDGVFNGGVTVVAASGFNIVSFSSTILKLYNCTLGVTTAHSSSDIAISSESIIFAKLYNSKLASSTEVANQSNMSSDSFIASSRHDQTDATNKVWTKYGTLSQGTQSGSTSGAPTQLLTPNNASNKLNSGIDFLGGYYEVPVSNGATVTVSVKIRKGAAYVGSNPRLMLLRDDSIGITADTALDSSSGGGANETWLTLSGTTGAASQDGLMRFYVDCDGTADVVDVDDWSS